MLDNSQLVIDNLHQRNDQHEPREITKSHQPNCKPTKNLYISTFINFTFIDKDKILPVITEIYFSIIIAGYHIDERCFSVTHTQTDRLPKREKIIDLI